MYAVSFRRSKSKAPYSQLYATLPAETYAGTESASKLYLMIWDDGTRLVPVIDRKTGKQASTDPAHAGMVWRKGQWIHE